MQRNSQQVPVWKHDWNSDDDLDSKWEQGRNQELILERDRSMLANFRIG